MQHPSLSQHISVHSPSSPFWMCAAARTRAVWRQERHNREIFSRCFAELWYNPVLMPFLCPDARLRSSQIKRVLMRKITRPPSLGFEIRDWNRHRVLSVNDSWLIFMINDKCYLDLMRQHWWILWTLPLLHWRGTAPNEHVPYLRFIWFCFQVFNDVACVNHNDSSA